MGQANAVGPTSIAGSLFLVPLAIDVYIICAVCAYLGHFQFTGPIARHFIIITS